MSSNDRKSWRVGVLGLGLMGRRMLGSLELNPKFEVVAGFDTNAELTASVAKQFKFAPSSSLSALLGHEGLDLVYVATPPQSHVDLSYEVLGAGHALFLEKPLAVNLAKARELVQSRAGSTRACAMNFPFATLPALQRIQRELADGTAGKLLRNEVVLHFSQWPRSWHTAGEWLSGNREGGFLREVFSHFAFLCGRLIGPLEFVSAELERNAAGVEARVLAQFQSKGVPVTLMGGSGGAAPDFNRWTLYCENHCYRVENWSIVTRSTREGWQPLQPEESESVDTQGQLQELDQMLRGAEHRLPTLEEGLAVMEAVEAMLASDFGN